MSIKGPLLVCAFFGVCTAVSCDPLETVAATRAAVRQDFTDTSDPLGRGHERPSRPIDASMATGRDRSTVGHAVKPEAMPLDSIAPRERSPNGSDRQPPAASKRAKAPIVSLGAVEATSGIPVDVIRRILRQHYGRYRQCYKKGLERHPNLRGEVRVRFAIELDGSTSNSRDDGSTLPDASVIRCMASVFGQISFPKLGAPWVGPDGGPMSVLVHFWLSPG